MKPQFTSTILVYSWLINFCMRLALDLFGPEGLAQTIETPNFNSNETAKPVLGNIELVSLICETLSVFSRVALQLVIEHNDLFSMFCSSINI